jgi:hypothetical protein
VIENACPSICDADCGLLSELDLDTHLIIRFNQAFSQLAAQTFVQEILLNNVLVTFECCLVMLLKNYFNDVYFNLRSNVTVML